MSDNYLILYPKLPLVDPVGKAKEVIGWLQEDEIIEKELSDSVLGGSGMGFEPGKNHLDLVVEEIETFYSTCGLDVRVGYEVFDVIDIPATIECPLCMENQFKDIKPEDFYGDNLNEELQGIYDLVLNAFGNYEEQRESKLQCHFCKEKSAITTYKLDGVCFSNLGFFFWNWPELKDTTIKKFEALLQADVQVKYGNL